MNRKNDSWLATPARNPIALSGGLAVVGFALVALGLDWAFLIFMAVLASIVVGQLYFLTQQRLSPKSFPKMVTQLIRLSEDPEISVVQEQWADSLENLAHHNDPIFRGLALLRLQEIVRQSQMISEGTIEYYSTEAWRVAYEELLRSPGLHLYRSVSHIESVHYWQDGPGQQSTKLNLELQDSRLVSVERIAIIADHLWLADSQYPMAPIHSWLDEQHRHGIWVRIVRESRLAQEKDLQLDFGIYGNRAVGVQDSDVSGRTVRFSLNFDFERVQRAEEMWERLAVYSTSYRDLLDQQD
jgi:hypothetical protein